MTTINNMLEQGATIQGPICVTATDHDGNDHVFFDGVDEWAGPIDDGWANQEVLYMFAFTDYEGAKLKFEIECPEHIGGAWACADCADPYNPEDGPMLERSGDWYTCPSCGCSTCAPAEDAC